MRREKGVQEKCYASSASAEVDDPQRSSCGGSMRPNISQDQLRGMDSVGLGLGPGSGSRPVSKTASVDPEMTSRPWNQHASSAQDLQVAKRLVTEDILERHSAGPHATHIPEAASLAGASIVGGKGMLTEPAEFVPRGMERATFAEEQRQQRMQTKRIEQGARTQARHGLVAEADMTQSTRLRVVFI